MGMTIDDFSLIKVVGKGSYGTVMLAKYNKTGEILAIKMLLKEYLIKKKQVTHTITERYVLEELKHPFIVQLKYAF
jgi:serine/threonine protein kinase